jgi:hypothetical protein
MASERYRDCGLYVEAVDQARVAEELRDHFRVGERHGVFFLPAAELQVGYGSEWPGLPDNYYGWRATIDVSAEPHTTDQEMVAFVTELMELVRSHGHRVVAECAFEDDLPQQDLDGTLERGGVPFVYFKKDPRTDRRAEKKWPGLRRGGR